MHNGTNDAKNEFYVTFSTYHGVDWFMYQSLLIPLRRHLFFFYNIVILISFVNNMYDTCIQLLFGRLLLT